MCMGRQLRAHMGQCLHKDPESLCCGAEAGASGHTINCIAIGMHALLFTPGGSFSPLMWNVLKVGEGQRG